MKKSILTITFITALSSIVLFSCKKDEPEAFKQTDVTGTTVVKGHISKEVVAPDGNGNWTNNNKINVAGVRVNIKVNKGGTGGLYPNSTSKGADVYSAVTDSTGNYAVTVKSNADGVTAYITIEGFNGTQDTLINGVTKKGLYASYAGLGTTANLVMSQTHTQNHNFVAFNVSSNPNNIVIGTALITGSVSMEWLKKITTGTNVAVRDTNVAVANVPVVLSLTKDPNILAPKVYQTTTDASGFYTFTVNTVASGTSGFTTQNATIWVDDFAARRDTLNYIGAAASGTLSGKQGVYKKTTNTQNNVYSSSIKNAANISCITFTAN